jgi:hypothetical protein
MLICTPSSSVKLPGFPQFVLRHGGFLLVASNLIESSTEYSVACRAELGMAHAQIVRG